MTQSFRTITEHVVGCMQHPDEAHEAVSHSIVRVVFDIDTAFFQSSSVLSAFVTQRTESDGDD